MIRDPRRHATGKTKRIAGHTLHRMTLATVERVWKRLHETHYISGIANEDGRELATAVPKRAGTSWIGYTMDGQTWFGCHIEKRTEAMRLLNAVAQKVRDDR